MELSLLMAAIICFVIYWWLHQPDVHIPPYPRRPLPVVGNLFHLGKDPRPIFKKWRKQIGDIFSLNMGGTLVVVLNGYDIIKEALVKKADFFSDRSPYFIDTATGIPGKGVAFSSGHDWKEQRSVALTILRKFGMGKNILAEKIQEEVTSYVNYLASMKGKPTNIRTMTNISASNVICSIIIGRRFEYDDVEFQNLIALLNSIALEQQNVSLINFISWLKYLPGDIFKAKRITRNVQEMCNLLNRFVNEKKQNEVDSSSEAENLIEAYMAERNKKLAAGVSTYMDDESLTKIINDLFAAGTETTSTTIYWCIVYILNFPDVQEKVYREIKDIVGTDRKPNMQDRSKLPYLNAVITETQRLASIVPLSLIHMCPEDVTLRGYNIPKGTYIIPNLDSVLHDKTTWGEDVMSFRPERFLDSNSKLLEREELIPFGIGRRVCLGEALAKMELFLFLSNLFQHFQFLPKGTIPPTYTDYEFGLACAPRPYEVRILERQ